MSNLEFQFMLARARLKGVIFTSHYFARGWLALRMAKARKEVLG